MKYLLDTHAIIWLMEDSLKMPSHLKEIIKSPDNTLYICSISLWEIAIKINLNKLKLGLTFDELLYCIKNSDLDILQIEDKYLQKLSEVPFLHKDPFDRLLISSALVENITIITIDDQIHQYNVPWIW
ncbi:MAG: type II toxin-antitoxin system VapC family toxin [Clostridiales bacterium]|nr:type II toxin-antitoxin system VapC family toxin [Clostridiales bacterium]